MNCEHFHQRMQNRLDERLALNADPDMVEHADVCGKCRSILNVWLSIESAIASPMESTIRQEFVARRRLVYALVSIAASLLLLLNLTVGSRSGATREKSVVSLRTETSAPIDSDTTLQAAQWWANMRQDDWFAQTMPAVRSVQEGVAPLGRSLIQAITILTVGDPGQTS